MKSIILAGMIRDARLAKNLTQGEVAKVLGFQNSQFVYMIESAISKPPLDVIGKLIVLLGLDEDKVMDILARQYRISAQTQVRAGMRAAAKLKKSARAGGGQ